MSRFDITAFFIGAAIGLCMISILLAAACETTPPEKYRQTSTQIQGMAIEEFTYEGCTYIKLYQGISHKGNCPSQDHCRVGLTPEKK